LTQNIDYVVETIRGAAQAISEGRLPEAEAALRAIIEANPKHPDAWHILGLALLHQRRGEEAISAFRNAISFQDDNAAFHHNLGIATMAAEQFPESEEAYRQATILNPFNVDHFIGLGSALRKQKRAAEAEEVMREAVKKTPDSLLAVNELALALDAQGKTKEAEKTYRKALDIGEAPALYFNLGNMLKDQHRADEALLAYDRAIELKPNFAEAHVHAAYVMLLKGNFELGWREYEWRWAVPDFLAVRRKFQQHVWNGEQLNGERLFLHAEQGFGDTLQFSRYASVAAAMGGKVILECQPTLVRLMQTLPGVDEVIAQGDPVPAFDLHLPLLSCPMRLGTTLKTIPNEVPYLFAEKKLVSKWKKKLSGKKGLKVGIVWQGMSSKLSLPDRACPLSAFKPLLKNPDIDLFSLQKEPPEAEFPYPEGLTDLSGELKDFADTAAIMKAMDLIVSIDTAVAHLAGALGHPVWLVLPTVGEWRWLMDRDDSPWYRSLKIFRQAKEGDWEGVLTDVAAEAAALSSQKA